MKLLIGLLSLAMLGMTGCATPGYSAKQRGQMIEASNDYNLLEMTNDVDHALLLYPASHMSDWNVIHSY